MKVYSQIRKRRLRVGGEQHTGWKLELASTPLHSPVRDLDFEFQIKDDGNANFLLCYSSLDGSLYGDTWHQTFAEAAEVALVEFGIQTHEWELIEEADSQEGHA
jgi:hypothetical protein